MITKRSVLQTKELVESAIARLENLAKINTAIGPRIVDIIDRDLTRTIDALEYMMELAD